MKKFISAFLCALFLLSALTGVITADMPKEPTVTLENKLFPDSDGSLLPFDDAKTDSWFYTAVQYAYSEGIINGITETLFSPDTGITREMFVTVIGRRSGDSVSKYTSCRFSDVAPDSYYAPFIEWAADNSIVSGKSSTEFSPDEYITREQMAAIMVNFAAYKGINTSPSPSVSLSVYPDGADVSEYAQNAILWANEKAIINGSSGMLLPRQGATRAQAVQIIYNFICAVSVPAESFTVSNTLSSDMIVQRNARISLWGTANPSENGHIITATFGSATGRAMIQNGEWKLTFGRTFTANAELGNSIIIKGKPGTEVEFTDVLVGDVYMFIGQSNCWFYIRRMVTANPAYRRYVNYSDDQPIRILRSSSTDLGTDAGTSYSSSYVWNTLPDDRGWELPSSCADDTSALGYLFIQNLALETGVPVGLIQVDASGCAISAFCPAEICEKYDMDYQLNSYMYHDSVDATTISRFAYNRLISPLLNFTISGMLWYQGESDLDNTDYNFGGSRVTFKYELAALMDYLRNTLPNSNYPIYFMEFAPVYSNGGRNNFMPFGVVRSEYGTILNLVDNAYMTCSADSWYDDSYHDNIHPYGKPILAERTIKIALANTYGIGNTTDVCGASFFSAKYEENRVTVIMNDTQSGLSVCNGLEPHGVQIKISPNGNNWIYADNITLDGNRIIVDYNGTIYGVRYDFEEELYWGYPGYNNLCSGNGMPVIAFADYRQVG